MSQETILNILIGCFGLIIPLHVYTILALYRQRNNARALLLEFKQKIDGLNKD